MEVRYRKPVHTNGGKLTLKAHATEVRRNLVTVVGEIYNSEGVLCTECSCLYFLFSKEKAASEMGLTACLVEGEE
jgi:acyl-coenzyme A thioesterase PaaI-like protein